MSSTRQAADRIYEDQVLNFLVSQLSQAFSPDFAGNTQLDDRDLYEVLVGACADGTSLSALCTNSTDTPHPNTVLHHLRTKFDLDTVEEVGNSLHRTELLDTLPEQVEVVVDLHLRPYYGDEDDTEGLYYSKAKAGTTAFHAYATLYARVKNKRYTLAVRRHTAGDTASDALAEFCGLLESFAFDVEAVYLDREFYDSKCLTLLSAHNFAYVMPIVKWGNRIQDELSTGWSRQISHSLQADYADHEWTVEFPVFIDCTYQQGRYDEHGVARHGYAADAPFIDRPEQARYHYSKRFGFESSYRLGESTTA